MIHRLITLDCFCDECLRTMGDSNNEPMTAPGSSFPTQMKEARKIMKYYGWGRKKVRGKMIDICPECKKILGE